MKFTVGNNEVTKENGIVSWVSPMEIDADGSPRAYAPIGSGFAPLDDLRNAGYPGKFYGVVCNSNGVPYVQLRMQGDPCPGYYISPTALSDRRYGERNPRRYVDSEKVPYIAVPPELERYGVRLGDLAIVKRGAFSCGAVVADIGPHNLLGEGSILLAQILGVDPFRGLPKHKLLGIDEAVSFTVFLDSAASPPWPIDVQSAVDARVSNS